MFNQRAPTVISIPPSNLPLETPSPVLVVDGVISNSSMITKKVKKKRWELKLYLDPGKYICSIWNYFGKISEDFVLKIDGPQDFQTFSKF